MKNSITILILLSAVLSSRAQELQWEKVFQKGFTHEVIDFKLLPNDEFLIFQDFLADDYRHQYKCFISSDSTCDFKNQYVASTDYYRLLTNSNQEIELISVGIERGGGCNWCVLGYYGEWVFSQSNLTTDENCFSNNYLEPDNFAETAENWTLTAQSRFPLPVGFFQLGDTTMIIASDSGFVNINYNDLVGIKSYDLGILATPIVALFQRTDSTGLAFSQNEVFEMNQNGSLQLLNQLNFSIDTIYASDSGDGFICITNGVYRFIDEQGAELSQFNPNDYFDSVRQFDILTNGFRGLGFINNEIHLIEFINNTEVLNFIPDTFKFDIQRFAFNVSSSEFYLIGYETAVDNKHLILQKFGYNVSNYQKTDFDLGLSDLKALNTYGSTCVTNPEWYPNTTFSILFSSIQTEFTVTNYSATAIDSFFVNADYEFQGTFPYYNTVCNTNCRDSYFSKKFIKHLEPGESLTLPLNLLNGNNVITPLPVCYWVSSPNFQPDRNPSNDKTCLLIPVSIDEVAKIDSEIRIYPNPTSDILNIVAASNLNIESMEIYDFSGKLMWSNDSSNNFQTLQVDQFANGVFMLRIIEKSGKSQGSRFIIQK